MLELILLLLFLGIIAFFVQRTQIGQRFKGQYPRWVLSVAGVRPPAYFRTAFSYQVTWLLRRVYPLVLGIAALKVAGVLTGESTSIVPLTTTTWITLAAGSAAVWTAGISFAPNRRNGPLSLWVAWLGSVVTIAGALTFQAVALGYEAGWFGVVHWLPVTQALSTWTSLHTLEDSVAFTLTVVGLGIATLALQESAPNLGDPQTTPADMKLGDQEIGPSALEDERKGSPVSSLDAAPRNKNQSRKKRKRRKRRRR